MFEAVIGEQFPKGVELVWVGNAIKSDGVWRPNPLGTLVKIRFFPVYPEYQLPKNRYACFIGYEGFSIDLQRGMLQARIRKTSTNGAYYEVLVEEVVS